jgi:hypothetical protein
LVDPSSHNTNPPGVFDGEAVPIPDAADARLEEAVATLREFVDQRGRRPTAESWTEAAMRPSDKTIRRRFGSFQKAVATAGLSSARR